MEHDHERRSDLISSFHRLDAGFIGERHSDRFLERAMFRGPVRIFANVELEITPFNFIQIDTLVMTQSFIFILEVKNISGELRFIENPPSLHRTLKNGEELVLDCPVYQLEKNMIDFDLWLEMNGFQLKSKGALVLAFTSSIVKISPVTMPIFYAKQLPHFLRMKESDSPIMSRKQFEKIADKLSKANRPFNPTPLCNYLRVNPTTITGGVLCIECHGRLSRISGKTWTCPRCEKLMNNALADNLKDWFILMKDHITTEECRQFLELKDKAAAIYALKSLPLEKRGKSVATKYCFPSLTKTLRN